MMVSVNNAMLEIETGGSPTPHRIAVCVLMKRAARRIVAAVASGRLLQHCNRQLGMGPDDGPPSQAPSASLPRCDRVCERRLGAQFGRVPPQSLL